MILISHRGNLHGPDPAKENNPEYIEQALALGYDVEVDLWVTEDLYLGHDEPQYKIKTKWLEPILDRLWIHCKNTKALEYVNHFKDEINIHYFWHEEDTVTLTSKNFIWAYPGKQSIKNSIAVMPEIYNDPVENCLGICSDYIQNYKK